MDKKLTIALDLDDTITTFMPTCIETYNKIYKTNHTIDEITEWEIDGIFEHCLWSIFAKSDILENMPLKEGAFNVIKKWHEQGYRIVIVTGVVDLSTFMDKVQWLSNVELREYITDIIPTIHKELINADVLIDDNPNYLRNWQIANPNGLTLLMTAQHNKNKDFTNEFIRVNDWYEIDLLMECAKERLKK